ncbi:hypothetical protein Acr_29g0006760 [Actinidia rufa]|uniref:Uncharacterized protein n=1 Tax=Actinidia rufa TaxID=165716 RepID=A0A7J0HFW4_9ERIC|nr:hypothetical protein Acr_29g0006760 [Actinidia rufa]
MSAHGLWTKLKEMYWEKTSQNKALMRRLVVKLQRETKVAEQMSEFQRATGRGQKKRSQEGGHRDQEKRSKKKYRQMTTEGKIQRSHFKCFYCDQEGQEEFPRNKAQDQSSKAATTAMMAVDESDVLLAASADEESDWISDSGNTYHLCRDREVFSTHVTCEGLVRMTNNTTKSCWQRNSLVPHGRREIHEGDRGKACFIEMQDSKR